MNKGCVKLFVAIISQLENNEIESSIFFSIAFSYPAQKQLIDFPILYIRLKIMSLAVEGTLANEI